jgi:tRNA 2-thiouridine synthesizing protein A
MGDITPDRVVDCLCLFCPEPVLRTRKEIENISVGGILKVIADDPSSEEDIKAWAKHTGHELIRVEKVSREFHFYIRRVK